MSAERFFEHYLWLDRFKKVGSSGDGSMLVEGNSSPERFPSIIIGRYEHDGESIVCLPSQIGCVNGCAICSSAGPFFFPGEEEQKPFLRNLKAAEIVLAAVQSLELYPPSTDSKGLVFSLMGMGEAFDNIENVKLATELLGGIYPDSRFTISTIAKNPKQIKELAKEIHFGKYKNTIKLHISLHAATDEKRRTIIPKAASIEDTLKAAEYFAKETGTTVKLNYVFLEGINNGPEDIDKLVSLLKGRKQLSLIISDYNSGESGLDARRIKADEFANQIRQSGIAVERFTSQGVDIQAGCGQLTFDRLKVKN